MVEGLQQGDGLKLLDLWRRETENLRRKGKKVQKRRVSNGIEKALVPKLTFAWEPGGRLRDLANAPQNRAATLPTLPRLPTVVV